MKVCGRCKVKLSLASFSKSAVNKDGLHSWCKSCAVEANRIRSEKFKEQNLNKKKPAKRQTCFKCKKSKNPSSFYIDITRKTGLSNFCKDCSKKDRKEYGKRKSKEFQEGAIRPETKVCPQCKRKLSSSQFNLSRISYDGLSSRCSECASLEKLGLTLQQYNKLLEMQNGKCAVCQIAESNGHGRFHVDHDHSCCPGRMKCGNCALGLVCSKCNLAMGSFKDSSDLIKKASNYLRIWSDKG